MNRSKANCMEAAKAIKVGNPLDESSDMGPVISSKHRDKVIGYIDQGVKEGAKLILDGRSVSVEGFPDGSFVGPTIFDEVDPGMTIAQEEIFGPVASIVQVDDLEQAMDIIEANRYGNAASIFTSSGRSARDFKHRVRAGQRWDQRGSSRTDGFLPVQRDEGVVLRRPAWAGSGRRRFLHREEGSDNKVVLGN